MHIKSKNLFLFFHYNIKATCACNPTRRPPARAGAVLGPGVADPGPVRTRLPRKSGAGGNRDTDGHQGAASRAPREGRELARDPDSPILSPPTSLNGPRPTSRSTSHHAAGFLDKDGCPPEVGRRRDFRPGDRNKDGSRPEGGLRGDVRPGDEPRAPLPAALRMTSASAPRGVCRGRCGTHGGQQRDRGAGGAGVRAG